MASNTPASAAATAMFSFFDDNKDGGLTLQELKVGMESVGSKMDDKAVEVFFKKVGTENAYRGRAVRRFVGLVWESERGVRGVGRGRVWDFIINRWKYLWETAAIIVRCINCQGKHGQTTNLIIRTR